MKKFYDRPTMVIFDENLAVDSDEIVYQSGIAYHDEIICACCGGVFELDEVEILKELSWINIREEVGGDELIMGEEL